MMQRDYQHACMGKAAHMSRGSAAEEAARLSAGHPGVEYEAYSCRHCAWFHTGHALGWQMREAVEQGLLWANPGAGMEYGARTGA